MNTRRVVFNLNTWLEELQLAIIDQPNMIDEVVSKYQKFLFRSSYKTRERAKNYIEKHSLLTDNEQLNSYVNHCHSKYFTN